MNHEDTIMSDEDTRKITHYDAGMGFGQQRWDTGVEGRDRCYKEIKNAQAKTTWDKAIKEVVDFIESRMLGASYDADPSKKCWGLSDHEIDELKKMAS